MKKINRILLFALFASSAIACSKDYAAEPNKAIERVPSSIKITAQRGAFNDSETDLNKWVSTDTLTVMDSVGRSVNMVTRNSGVDRADFNSNKWEGGKITFGVCSPARDSVEYLSDDAVRMSVASAQYLVEPQKLGPNALASVGKVYGSPGSFVDTLYNVTGLLKIEILRSDIAKLVIKSRDGNMMAGWVDVNFKELVAGNPYWTASQGMKTYDCLTITGQKGSAACDTLGCIQTGTYYFAALPGNYAQGLDVSIFGVDGKELSEPTVEKGFTLARNEVHSMKKIDIFPATMILEVKFNTAGGVNPLGTFVEESKQTTNGETYYFEYTVPGTTYTEKFPLTLCKGSAAGAKYLYQNNSALAYGPGYILNFTGANAWVRIPMISGKYLQAVTTSCANTAGRYMRIKEDGGNGKPAGTSIAQSLTTVATKAGPGITTIHFYTNGNDCLTTSLQGNTTKASTVYYIQYASATLVDGFTFVFTDTLPTRN